MTEAERAKLQADIQAVIKKCWATDTATKKPMQVTRDTYIAAVRTYGVGSQLIMAMEEMAELTKELSKNIRGERNVSAISEEIADVEIMLEQLKIIFCNRAEVDWTGLPKDCLEIRRKSYTRRQRHEQE